MKGGIAVRIKDGQGGGLEAHVHRFGGKRRNIEEHSGLLVLQERFLNFNPEVHPFLNDDFGTAMNQNITFGGAKLRATVIHAGVNSGSADSGTTDGIGSSKLIQSGQNFEATIGPGALVHNTTDTTFALVTAVDSDTQISLDADIMASGENYVINDIWVGTAVAGTWNFADSGKFTITSANDNDEATFTVDTAHIWNMSDFKALTGKVDLDTFNDTNHTIVLEFGLDGVIVGNTVNLNDFIDTGDFTEQSFVIPKEDLGLVAQNVNSMRITILRSGGAKPTMKFDDFQWENSGTPAVFKSTIPRGAKFHITEIRLRFEDAISTVLTDATMPNLLIDQFLGVSGLTNGILFQRVQRGKVLFAVLLKNLGDFLAVGSDLINATGNATNTGFTLVVTFPEPIVLEGISDEFLSFTISDNLSGLTRFTAVARGAIEV